MDIEKIQTLSPLQVAEHFYHDEYGTPLDDELKEMLKEAQERIRKKWREEENVFKYMCLGYNL